MDLEQFLDEAKAETSIENDYLLINIKQSYFRPNTYFIKVQFKISFDFSDENVKQELVDSWNAKKNLPKKYDRFYLLFNDIVKIFSSLEFSLCKRGNKSFVQLSTTSAKKDHIIKLISLIDKFHFAIY